MQIRNNRKDGEERRHSKHQMAPPRTRVVFRVRASATTSNKGWRPAKLMGRGLSGNPKQRRNVTERATGKKRDRRGMETPGGGGGVGAGVAPEIIPEPPVAPRFTER